MAYLKINDIDFSMYVNNLKVTSTANYNAQTNAAGNTVVEYINNKRTIEVGIIPIDSTAVLSLQNEIADFNISLTFLNPVTGILEESVNCIIPSNGVEYYTIQANKVRYKGFNLTFVEL